MEIERSFYNTILVADLPEYCWTLEKTLRKLFKGYGIDRSPNAITIKKRCEPDDKSYALITFHSSKQANMAVADLNYSILFDAPIRLFLVNKYTMDIINSKETCLIVKNLDPDIEVSELHDAFSKFGDVITCEIQTGPVVINGEKISSQRVGFVYFRKQKDAIKVKNDLKGASINGRPIEIQLVGRHRNVNLEQEFTVCFIYDFPEKYTAKDLMDLFSEYGTPVSCSITKNEKEGSKRFGICKMLFHEKLLKSNSMFSVSF